MHYSIMITAMTLRRLGCAFCMPFISSLSVAIPTIQPHLDLSGTNRFPWRSADVNSTQPKLCEIN
ncbi:MAG: hypothetical protein KZQ60_14000 [Candidatus Thiodiazotropha sp. (ex Lucinoma aequizonata)]|nr:hypothetical protein [Candidatus Thiodiazotropha sp. (ex Lucinoma aequizonata)]